MPVRHRLVLGVSARFGRIAVRLATVATAIACAVPANGQSAQDEWELRKREQAKADVVRYHAMIDAYAAGDERKGVEALLRWNRARLDPVLARVSGREDPFSPWQPRRYGLAAMLHTDAALHLSGDLATTESFAYVEDASRMWRMGTGLHPTAVRPLAQRWYAALSRYLRDRRALHAADRLLSIGREHLPRDPVLLYESGTLSESFATDFALSATIVATGTRPDLSFDASFKRRAGRLNDAARWLREAAALDPGNDMLGLHLGRVQALRLEDEEALAILGAVLDRTDDDATAYLAAIFMGGVWRRQQRLEEAASAYRAAIARFSIGHAAYVGLSEVLQRAGRGDEAREVLRNLLAGSGGPTREPHWWYQFEPPGIADERLDAFRKEIRR